MSKVYIVAHGAYSDYHIDYHIVGVFDDEELAKKFKDLCNCDNIEEHELNPCRQQITNGYALFGIRMLRNGTIKKSGRAEAPYSIEKAFMELEVCLNPETEENYPYRDTGRKVLCATVLATTMRHAIKIVNEKRTQFIAEGKWLAENEDVPETHARKER